MTDDVVVVPDGGSATSVLVVGESPESLVETPRAAHMFYAGPLSGTGPAGFRPIDPSDIPGFSSSGNYTLPVASGSVLGGVKIGANITITGGTISVAPPVTSNAGLANDAGYVTTASLAGYARTSQLFSGAYADLSGKPTLFSGDYADLANKPTLGTAAQLGAAIANGVATLGSDAKLVSAQIPTSLLGQMVAKGPWDASTGTAPSASPQSGWYWLVTKAGTTSLGGITDWQVGDWAVYDSVVGWYKCDNTDSVSSVAGLTGVISVASLRAALSLAAVAMSGAYGDLSGRPTLGTAASTDATAYATAAQGAKADTAVQPAGLAGLATITGATAIAVVASLPGSPDANTLYFTTT